MLKPTYVSKKYRQARLFIQLSIGAILILPFFTASAQLLETRYVLIGGIVVPFEVNVPPKFHTQAILTVTDNGPYQASLVWAEAEGAQNYSLQILKPFANEWLDFHQTQALSYDTPDLNVGTNHFRVVACALDLCSVPSPFVSIVIEEDIDRDGVSDSHDLCEGTPAGVAVSAAGCEPTTEDSDEDGVTDDLDYCSGTPANESVNNPGLRQGGCSLGQRDSDQDGFNDAVDSYPFQHATLCVD